jgi:hypothetical protein
VQNELICKPRVVSCINIDKIDMGVSIPPLPSWRKFDTIAFVAGQAPNDKSQIISKIRISNDPDGDGNPPKTYQRRLKFSTPIYGRCRELQVMSKSAVDLVIENWSAGGGEICLKVGAWIL